MYGWGDDLSDWQRPSAYNYSGSKRAKQARKKAAKESKERGGRSYLNRDRPDMSRVSPHGKTIESKSTTPLVVAVDVTGSMSSWPAEIFDRLPLLYQTLSQYRPDLEISFVAIGDATCDSYPLQVCDFGAGVGLEDELNALYGEGGGGGQSRESYELFAYYLLTRARAPHAARPFLLLYGDEGFYDVVDPGQVRYTLGTELENPVSSLDVWRGVLESWNVFHLRKDYFDSKQDKLIKRQWGDAIGEERIVRLDEAERAVDLALGLVARSWGHYEDFERNMQARQSKATVRDLGKRIDKVEEALAQDS